MLSLFGALCSVWLGTFFTDTLCVWCAVTSTGWQSFCVCMLPFICRGLSTVLSFQSLNSLPWCSATHSSRFTLHCLTFSFVICVTLSTSWSSCWRCLEHVGFRLKLLWIFVCCLFIWDIWRYYNNNINNNRFTTLFRDHPGKPVPEENFWTLWCKGRLTEADTLAIRLGATPSGPTSAHLHHPPILFYRPDALPDAQPTVLKHWGQLAHSD